MVTKIKKNRQMKRKELEKSIEIVERAFKQLRENPRLIKKTEKILLN